MLYVFIESNITYSLFINIELLFLLILNACYLKIIIISPKDISSKDSILSNKDFCVYII
jgi:hypothetical protein